MTEPEIVRMLLVFYEGLFPKVCPNCGRVFPTLREYIIVTQPLWPSLDYDIELGEYNTSSPIGGLAMANCLCGTTMALSSKEMPLSQTHFILEWIRIETKRRGMNATQLLDHLRDEVRRIVLTAPASGAPQG